VDDSSGCEVLTDPRTEKATVLIVDDESLVCDLLAHFLRAAGYRVLAASSGDEAIRIVKQGVRRLDLLLTDFLMPGMDGSECAAQVRQLFPEVAVLFMTGTPDLVALSPILQRPRSRLMVKPFRGRELLRVVKWLLDSSEVVGAGSERLLSPGVVS